MATRLRVSASKLAISVSRMAIRDNTENYFDEAYWNSRYTQDAGPFDWYQQYEGIAPVIKMHSQPSDRVLMVGCGSARV